MKNNAVGLPISYAHPNAQWRDRSGKTPRILWQPSNPEATPMSRYRQHINKKFKQNLKTSKELHKWSCENPHEFWIDLYEYTEIIPALPVGFKHAYNPTAKFRDIPAWFEGVKLNFAENLLMPNVRSRPDAIALTGLRDGKLNDPEHITWSQLYDLIRIMAAALRHHGLKQGDVVAALMSNSIWIIVVFLATASIGAIFTSIAPDMGLSGCLSRLIQVSPKFLFTDADYAVRGKRISLLEKVMQILAGLPEEQHKPITVFVPTTKAPHQQHHNTFSPTIPPSLSGGHTTVLSTFLVPATRKLSPTASSYELKFTRVPPGYPIKILYSSGTTGPPKCIVSPHISLLNYRKIALLHNSITPESIVFQYSSTSWVLWNVMLGHMTVGARLITFDGNPLYPDAGTPLEICERYGATYWGTSPRHLLELEQQVASRKVTRQYDLSKLKMVTTTGAPLLQSQMLFFYSPLFPAQAGVQKVHLSSVAGGTDIASSWIASDPAAPLYLGEMQMWALGHDCAILKAEPTKDNDGKLIYTEAAGGEAGELICRKPLPSAPPFFWGDDERKSKYMDAYFDSFPVRIDSQSGDVKEHLDVWAQHDLTVCNPVTKGLQIQGRSDTTLNPSGIRFGSSEIYHIIEAPPLNSLISDSLCVGRRRKQDDDEVVFLFLIPAKGVKVDEELIGKVRNAIKTNLSSRHVPKFIFEVKEIPYTVNGKKVENVIKKIISGIEVTPSSTITNPHCLEAYRQYRDVKRAPQSSKL